MSREKWANRFWNFMMYFLVGFVLLSRVAFYVFSFLLSLRN